MCIHQVQSMELSQFSISAEYGTVCFHRMRCIRSTTVPILQVWSRELCVLTSAVYATLPVHQVRAGNCVCSLSTEYGTVPPFTYCRVWNYVYSLGAEYGTLHIHRVPRTKLCVFMGCGE